MTVIATFINFLLSLPLLFGVLLLFGVTFGWSLLALPLIMTAQFALTLGLTLIISALCVRYRDIPPILGHVLMFLFFLTPNHLPCEQRARALSRPDIAQPVDTVLRCLPGGSSV